jgi:hypothetical protein
MATVSHDESSRLAALRQYRILDTEPEVAFDDLALLASHICETPIALISLVDADRQWFKAHPGIAVTQTSRALRHALVSREKARSTNWDCPSGGPIDSALRAGWCRATRGLAMGARTGPPRFARKRLPGDMSFRPLSTKGGCPSGS